MVVESKKDPKNAEEGEHVAWNWGASRVEGDVTEKKEGKLTIETKGKQVSKDGTKDNPAIHVKRKGNDVVKRASELAVLDPKIPMQEDIPKGEKVMTRAQAAKAKGNK